MALGDYFKGPEHKENAARLAAELQANRQQSQAEMQTLQAKYDEHPTTKICPGFIFAALRSSSAAIRTSWRSSSNCPAVSISFKIPVALILLPPDLMPEKAADQTG